MLIVHVPSASGTPPPGVDAVKAIFDNVVHVDTAAVGDTVPVPNFVMFVKVYSYASAPFDVHVPDSGVPRFVVVPPVRPLRATDQLPSLRSWNTCEPAAPAFVVKNPYDVAVPAEVASGFGGADGGVHTSPTQDDPFHVGLPVCVVPLGHVGGAV